MIITYWIPQLTRLPSFFPLYFRESRHGMGVRRPRRVHERRDTPFESPSKTDKLLAEQTGEVI
jgi:hypothetical protein